MWDTLLAGMFSDMVHMRFEPQPGVMNQAVDAVLIPEIDVSPYGDVSPDPRTVGNRLAALERLRAGEAELVIVSLRSLLRKTIPAAAFASLCREWCRRRLPRRQADRAKADY